MTSLNVSLESPNVKTDDAGQVLLTYEEIVEQIQEKIQVGLYLYMYRRFMHICICFQFLIECVMWH